MVTCPNCGGEVWDNRKRKAEGKMNPKAPDFACKDKEVCKWVRWPDRDAKPAKAPVSEPTSVRDIFALYCEARDMAVEAWRNTPVGSDPNALAAATHTLFLDARKEGRRAAKKPRKEKPMPPIPDPEEWERMDDGDESIPF